MTGFGRHEQNVGDKTFLIDIKSLNGKQFDLVLKLPALLRPYEFEIRKELSEKLLRGTVECIISLKDTGSSKPVNINTQLAKAYYKPLKDLSDELHLDPSSILSSLLKMPEVITPATETLLPEEWDAFLSALHCAIDNINRYRLTEGASLYNDLKSRIITIMELQKKVMEFDEPRKQKVRDGLTNVLNEKLGPDNFDTNRLEQELIFYIEKMDFSEEQVRLDIHCRYFIELLDEAAETKGKKLSFVLQEVGREINTTGSKAYDAPIQKIVVAMKDELEKAKEQILNVL